MTGTQAGAPGPGRASPADQPAQTLVDVLRHSARRHADEMVFGFLDPDTQLADSLTYRSLLLRATGFARLLADRGLSGRSALLVYPQGPEFIVAFFAANIAGVAAVPVRLPRRTEGTAALSRMAGDAEAAAVLVDLRQRDAVAGRFAAEPALAALPLLSEPPDSARAGADQAHWPGARVRPGDVALLQYTSGSTGDPKGVQVTQANLIANSQTLRVALGNDAETVAVSWLPMHHDMGLIGCVLQPVYVGFRNYFLSPAAVLQQPSRWLAAISRWQATASGGPNFGYELCARRPPPAGSAPLDLSAWRLAYTGAEPVLAATIERFCARYRTAGFSPQAFYPCYGLAEATLMVTGGHRRDAVRTIAVDGGQIARGRAVPCTDGPSARRLVGCGHPRPGVDLVIVDPQTGQQVSPGQVGEIWVAGPGVAAGYRNRPALNEATFGARLAGRPGVAFLRTGDLGFVADGELFVVGRLHDRIIIRGRNFHPEDIETTANVACARWEATGCAVFAAADDAVGATQGVVVAVELPRRLDEAQHREITALIRERVAAAHGVAVTDVVAVPRWRLPRTTSGKLRRSECNRRYRAGALAAPGRNSPTL
ncbi:MAG TPA: fatty acyl-AMP ligase [Streptosporangiaceae bacterium]